MLRGLKENVIMGRLIPAGTGLSRYRDFEASVVETSEENSSESVTLSL